ncbi:hypothetical protein niasHT_006000 [Heterodera trifolii]|uniref:Uncharacterized protein n=1 Tax=Heterodera trifolii TaxID=157864 RepID=A0ABD2LY34_9BILA
MDREKNNQPIKADAEKFKVKIEQTYDQQNMNNGNPSDQNQMPSLITGVNILPGAQHGFNIGNLANDNNNRNLIIGSSNTGPTQQTDLNIGSSTDQNQILNLGLNIGNVSNQQNFLATNQQFAHNNMAPKHSNIQSQMNTLGVQQKPKKQRNRRKLTHPTYLLESDAKNFAKNVQYWTGGKFSNLLSNQTAGPSVPSTLNANQLNSMPGPSLRQELQNYRINSMPGPSFGQRNFQPTSMPAASLQQQIQNYQLNSMPGPSLDQTWQNHETNPTPRRQFEQQNNTLHEIHLQSNMVNSLLCAQNEQQSGVGTSKQSTTVFGTQTPNIGHVNAGFYAELLTFINRLNDSAAISSQNNVINVRHIVDLSLVCLDIMPHSVDAQLEFIKSNELTPNVVLTKIGHNIDAAKVVNCLNERLIAAINADESLEVFKPKVADIQREIELMFGQNQSQFPSEINRGILLYFYMRFYSEQNVTEKTQTAEHFGTMDMVKEYMDLVQWVVEITIVPLVEQPTLGIDPSAFLALLNQIQSQNIACFLTSKQHKMDLDKLINMASDYLQRALGATNKIRTIFIDAITEAMMHAENNGGQQNGPNLLIQNAKIYLKIYQTIALCMLDEWVPMISAVPSIAYPWIAIKTFLRQSADQLSELIAEWKMAKEHQFSDRELEEKAIRKFVMKNCN